METLLFKSPGKISNPGPKPLAPNPLVPNLKPRGFGLTLKSHGLDRIYRFSEGKTKCRSPMWIRTMWNSLALFLIVNL